jgi:rhodanese-related sulfurtransferase
MKEIGPKEAYDLLQKDPEYVYLDVRSIPEFEQGHPIRAINIPLLHFSPGMGMMPNEDFPAVAEANLALETKLVVGYKTGMRSARACEILSQLGYTNVTNVRGGFVGVMDQRGNVTEPGWSLLRLPVCAACEEGSAYETLSKKAKK